MKRVSGAIYRIAPKGFVPKVPAFDASTVDGPDNGAAIAGGQRPRDRVRRAEGARRGCGERGRGAAQRSQPVHARPRHLSPVSARSRGPEARGRARVVHGAGDAHRRLPRDAARRARHHAGGSAARARRGCRCPPRSGAVHARPVGRAGPRHPGRHRPRLRRAGSHLPGGARHRRHRKGAGALRSAEARARRAGRSAGMVTGVRAPRVAAARARGGAGPHRARTVREAADRRPPARAGHARLHQGSRRVEGDARARAEPMVRCATWRPGGC